jgi:hypothetical protein
MPTFKTKFTEEPTASIAIWLHLTEQEYAVIRSMVKGKQSPNQLLKEIAERAIHKAIDAKRPGSRSTQS